MPISLVVPCSTPRRLSHLAAALLISGAAAWAPAGKADAAITTLGDVSQNIPSTGGNYANNLKIGILDYGSLTISNGPGITLTSAFDIIAGDGNLSTLDGTTAVGVIILAGIGSNLSTSNNVILGNVGTGSMSLTNVARLTMGQDLILGQGQRSSGNLFVENLGTVVTIGDSAMVGMNSNGLVQVTNGGRVTAVTSNIGQLAAGDGRIVVSGNNALWRQSGQMTIGDAGRGDLQVLSQGRVENSSVVIGNGAAGVGLALINGTGSVWETKSSMIVGAQGTATLRVYEGARSTVATTVRLATAAASEGHVEVFGLNSLWSIGTTATIGEFGYGTVTIANGGRVTSTGVVLADNSGSRGEVEITGDGSLWEVAGGVTVGDAGEARLAVSSGGRLSATVGMSITGLGELVLNGGRVEVAGSGLSNNGVIRGGGRLVGAVSNSSLGKIRTQAGFTLTVAGNLVSNGLVHVDGGEMEVLGTTANAGDIDITNGIVRFGTGLNNNNNGQLAITAGLVDVFGTVTNATGAQIVVGAESHAVFHDAVTSSGQVFVMPGANVLMLENLSFGSSSALTMQLAGNNAMTEVGKVEVGGQATLAGNLAVSLADGFAPTLGDSFEVLTAANGLSGAFGTSSLPALGAGLAWDLDYTATSLTLNVVAGAPADFNGDNFVNSADFNVWKNGFGTPAGASKTTGDADGDGDVDGSDFLSWQRQFGVQPQAGPSAASVPEPGALALWAPIFAAILAKPTVFRRKA